MTKTLQKLFPSLLIIALALALLPTQFVSAAIEPKISEFQPNPAGTDPTSVSFELSGAPSAAFDLWILSVENDGYNGLVDRASNVTGSFDTTGLVTVTIGDLENPSFTVILTDNFTGSTSTSDIDPLDNGTLDLSTLGTILDAVGVSDATGDDSTLYGVTLGGADILYNGVSEPLLAFRDGTNEDWYSTVTGSVFDAAGNELSGTDFDNDPTVSDTFNTFGSINPSYSPGVDTPPTVSSTTPTDSATGVAIDANVEINFSEDVTVADHWIEISCTISDVHLATASGGPQNFTLDPVVDFNEGESCTVTTTAAQVADLDGTPDNMETDFVFSFTTFIPLPPSPMIINEVDSDTPGNDAAEFVELFDGGDGNTSLDGLVIVFINGSDDASYLSFDLDGQSTDADGYFVLGNPGVTNVDLTFAPGSFGALQNGADAVALLVGDAADFPNDTPVTTANLIDAIVYDTNDGDDAGLLPLLNAGQPQVNESGGGNSANQSNQRCPNGSGGAFNTDTYAQFAPTPGEANTCVTPVIVVKIHEVQGSGLASPLVGNTVAIEGIVVGDFQDGASGVSGDLNGFFVQEDAADIDGDALTSEGIFVYDGSSPLVNVAVGDLVSVEGAVSEFDGMTEITSFSGVTVLSSGNPLPTASVLALPVTNVDDFESYEGMYVTFPQALVISEYYNFDRFNEIILTSERHLTPTAEFEPGPAAIQAAQDFLLDKITLDDGRTNQNPDPAIHPNGGVFDLSNLFRGGDTVTDLTGVMHYAFGLYRIQPTQGANHNNTNPRTGSPEPVGGDLKVASFNVLNYFTTLDDAGSICGPLADQDCRGADDATEFTRQRDKIIAALAEIDADVVGLLEIENYPGDVPTADLVSGLNAAVGAGTYDYVATGAVGSDAIRVAVIYKPASVSALGAFAVLDSSVDARFNDSKNRPTLAQTFRENSTGAVFTIAVNHLKSKGSDCDDVGDFDLGDGAGNCNLTRKAAAEAMVDWLASDPTGSGDEDFLIIGDLNSYDKEDPIDALVAGGYTDLSYAFHGEGAYSYVFDGQVGYLDYALASADLLDEVTGVAEWHINADEPDLIDYDTSFKQAAQDAIYAPDAYRSSDHDPVVVGLDLEIKPRLGKEYVLETLIALRTTVTDKIDGKGLDKAIENLGKSLEPSYWVDDDHLESKSGKKVFDEEKHATKELMKIIKDGSPLAGDAQAAIDNFLLADSALAQTAMEAAKAACDAETDPKKQEKCEKEIDKAQKEFDKAADEIASGNFDKAIDKYKKAWEHATHALK